MSKELKKWMPMFWPEYLADTGHLSTTEHGAYVLLIAHYWVKGGVPWENEELVRRITRLTSLQWSRSRDVLRSFFDDAGRHKRIDKELAYAIEKSKRLSANAKHRHSNGKPVADTPTPTPTKKKERVLVDKSTNPDFEEFWKSIPRRLGSNPKHPARLLYEKFVKAGVDPAKINAAAKRWCINEPKPDTEFCPRAMTWLNQRQFEDYHADPPSESKLEFDPVTKLWGYKKGSADERA